MTGASAAEPGVAGFAISVNGAAVGPEALESVLELVVDGRLRVPDRLTLRLRDDELAFVDGRSFAVGAAITVTMAADEDPTAASPVFDGEITTLAPEFDGGTATLGILALDRGSRLQRAPRSATYQSMSYGEIANQVATRAGLRPGRIEGGMRLSFVQQANETDWDFLWRLAADVDFEVKVRGESLNFRTAGSPAGASSVALEMGVDLRAFHPRVTGVGQVKRVTVRGWDPKTAKAIVATAEPARTQSRPGITRDSLSRQFASGEEIVVDRPVIDQSHAQTLASSLAARNANGYVEGEGRADATPALTAGSVVSLKGIGTTFSGTYAVSGVRHVMRAGSGFETRFTIAGREDRSLLGLAGGAPTSGRSGWRHRVVVGVVTNNDDPDKLGRVRVRYPALGAGQEGWWARVVVPGAGANRGLLTLPLVGDEVLVAFEHGDEGHPYVLGSVYNGASKPGTLAATDGTFALGSDKKLTVTAKDALSLSSAGAATLTTKPAGDPPGAIDISSAGALTLKSDAAAELAAATTASLSAKTSMKLEAKTTMTVGAKTSMKLDGGGSVEISASGKVTIKAALISVEASGMLKLSGAQVMLG